jgi:hypothetical protein
MHHHQSLFLHLCAELLLLLLLLLCLVPGHLGVCFSRLRDAPLA